jgi:hypothetical protein
VPAVAEGRLRMAHWIFEKLLMAAAMLACMVSVNAASPAGPPPAGLPAFRNAIPADTPRGTSITGMWQAMGLAAGWEQTNSMMKPEVLAKYDAARAQAAVAGHAFMTNSARCLPEGMPAMIDVPGTLEILEAPQENEIIFLHSQDNQIRPVFLGEPHPSNVKPSYWGHSFARRTAGSLVIDTIAIDDRTTLNWFGLPHSAALHVVEEYRLTNDGRTLDLAMTLEDPAVLVAPWVVKKSFVRLPPHTRFEEYVCAERSRDALPPSE